MAYKEEEMRWALNLSSGQKRQIGPNIYNNPFRMRSGNWQIIEAPIEYVTHDPVAVNVPTEPVAPVELIPPPELEPVEYEVPVIEAPKPKAKPSKK